MHQVLNFVRHAPVCTINFSYYACVQMQFAAKTSIFSLFCQGLSRSKDLLFEDKYHETEDRVQLPAYIVEPLIGSMVHVDAFSSVAC